ncbi:AAA family ATPase [Bosea sp. (in: a-proteobacteria)]|uniref:AAA family ATPase n=1 Tax=Bosea sp. (in: a-proteobacteria) TaxID=1871050 RepID=UPI003F6F3B99
MADEAPENSTAKTIHGKPRRKRIHPPGVAPVETAATTIPVFDREEVERQVTLAWGFEPRLEEHLGPPPALGPEEGPRVDRLLSMLKDLRGSQRALLFGTPRLREALAQVHPACPSFAEVISLYERAAALSAMTGAPVSVPPVLLLGDPGIGKTHASKAIAAALGVDIHAFSCATSSDAQALLVGHPPTWRGARPGVLTEAMIASASAQPCVLLDEVDKFMTHPTEQPYAVLLSALEPENARAMRDEYLQVPFNVAKAFFILTANDAGQIPGFIMDRVLAFQIAPPSGDALVVIARNIVGDVVASLRGGVSMPEDVVLHRLARSNPRGIKKLVRLAYGFAAAAGRGRLELVDIDAAEAVATGTSKPARIGFLTTENGPLSM